MTDLLPDPPLTEWPGMPHSGVGRSHGTSNRMPFDRWFRYPAGFASDYVEHLMHTTGLQEGLVVDCFAGSGVTGTAARNLGLRFWGIEAHPMIAELAATKLAVDVDGASLRSAARAAVEAVGSDLTGRDWDAEAAEETDLVRRSFAPDVLRSLMQLRAIVVADEQAPLHLKWALLATLRDVAGVKVGWPYQRPGQTRRAPHRDVLRRFEHRCNEMADDLDTVTDAAIAEVRLGDSREASSWPAAGTADACVTSPPYLNNFDYADATRLEAYFWGEASSWKGLTSVIRADMVTATTQQSSKVEKALALAELAAFGPVGDDLVSLTTRLTDARRGRARGKEYDQVLPAYFLAMDQVLARLATALSPGAVSLWLVGDSAPYGVYVDTPALIGRLAERHGFTVDSDQTLRLRGNRWRRADADPSVQLTERLLRFHR